MRIYKLLLLLLVISSISYGLFPLYSTNKKSEEAKTKLKEVFHKFETPSDILYIPQECYLEDSISYKVYDNENIERNVQENIGYVNNKFGLYVYSTENFIKKADELVNSNGGDWGYVLIPYNVKDYDKNKWEKIFDLLARKHLIPVIQLWDVDLGDYEKQTRRAADFLTSFPWPISKKYISAYNEMNDSRFWKGVLDPEGYADILDYTISTFKARDPEFFIMNGAFNSTAPNNNGYMDQEVYMTKMNDARPGIFGRLDGWASHPYPQPHYRGKPSDLGRGSIRGYEWELEILKDKFNVSGLPVFITETGWPHMEGQTANKSYYDAKTVASYIEEAFENVWLPDDRVVAVMPFTIYYDPPFDHFSWVKKDGSVYEQFETIKSMQKTAGRPPVLKEVQKELLLCD